MAESSEVVRTRRLEIVDGKGNVRVVAGFLGTGEGPIFGVAVRDGHGRDRVWVLHSQLGAEVGLDFDGDTVAALTVSDFGEPNLYLDEQPNATKAASP